MNDLPVLAPSGVTVVFPKTLNDVSQQDFYSISVPLGSLQLVKYRNLIGVPWDRTINRYETADFPGSGGSFLIPLNSSGLQALATQVATDWYSWQLGTIDQQFAGIVTVDPGAFHDREWIQENARVKTRVVVKDEKREDLNAPGISAKVVQPTLYQVRCTFGFLKGYSSTDGGATWNEDTEYTALIGCVACLCGGDCCVPPWQCIATIGGVYQNAGGGMYLQSTFPFNRVFFACNGPFGSGFVIAFYPGSGSPPVAYFQHTALDWDCDSTLSLTGITFPYVGSVITMSEIACGSQPIGDCCSGDCTGIGAASATVTARVGCYAAMAASYSMTCTDGAAIGAPGTHFWVSAPLGLGAPCGSPGDTMNLACSAAGNLGGLRLVIPINGTQTSVTAESGATCNSAVFLVNDGAGNSCTVTVTV